MTSSQPHHTFVEERRPSVKEVCVGGGGTWPAAEMLRFVKGPDEQVYLDITHRLDAPAVYLSPNPAAVREALENHALTQALDAEPLDDVPAFIADIHKLLLKSFYARLGLARKAGQAVFGTSKALQAARSGQAVRLFYAADAGRDTLKALETTARNADIPVAGIGTKEAWGRVLQKDNVTVAAITEQNTAAELAALERAVRAL